MTRKEYSEQEALARAAALCSQGEHCISQIEEKLVAWGQSTDSQRRIIARLLDEKYIDESRFARAYAMDKFRYSRWGRVKIAYAMHQLSLGSDDIKFALDEIPSAEYAQLLRELLTAKLKNIKGQSDYERRGKLIRFALGRGFTMDEIMHALPANLESDDET